MPMHGIIPWTVARGRRGEPIFANNYDYIGFIDLLKDTSELWNLRFAAYCPMPNHYHIQTGSIQWTPQCGYIFNPAVEGRKFETNRWTVSDEKIQFGKQRHWANKNSDGKRWQIEKPGWKYCFRFEQESRADLTPYAVKGGGIWGRGVKIAFTFIRIIGSFFLNHKTSFLF